MFRCTCPNILYLMKNMSATSRNIIVAGCLHPFSKKTPGTFPKTTRRMQI